MGSKAKNSENLNLTYDFPNKCIYCNSTKNLLMKRRFFDGFEVKYSICNKCKIRDRIIKISLLLLSICSFFILDGLNKNFANEFGRNNPIHLLLVISTVLLPIIILIVIINDRFHVFISKDKSLAKIAFGCKEYCNKFYNDNKAYHSIYYDKKGRDILFLKNEELEIYNLLDDLSILEIRGISYKKSLILKKLFVSIGFLPFKFLRNSLILVVLPLITVFSIFFILNYKFLDLEGVVYPLFSLIIIGGSIISAIFAVYYDFYIFNLKYLNSRKHCYRFLRSHTNFIKLNLNSKNYSSALNNVMQIKVYFMQNFTLVNAVILERKLPFIERKLKKMKELSEGNEEIEPSSLIDALMEASRSNYIPQSEYMEPIVEVSRSNGLPQSEYMEPIVEASVKNNSIESKDYLQKAICTKCNTASYKIIDKNNKKFCIQESLRIARESNYLEAIKRNPEMIEKIGDISSTQPIYAYCSKCDPECDLLDGVTVIIGTQLIQQSTRAISQRDMLKDRKIIDKSKQEVPSLVDYYFDFFDTILKGKEDHLLDMFLIKAMSESKPFERVFKLTNIKDLLYFAVICDNQKENTNYCITLIESFGDLNLKVEGDLMNAAKFFFIVLKPNGEYEIKVEFTSKEIWNRCLKTALFSNAMTFNMQYTKSKPIFWEKDFLNMKNEDKLKILKENHLLKENQENEVFIDLEKTILIIKNIDGGE